LEAISTEKHRKMFYLKVQEGWRWKGGRWGEEGKMDG